MKHLEKIWLANLYSLEDELKSFRSSLNDRTPGQRLAESAGGGSSAPSGEGQ